MNKKPNDKRMERDEEAVALLARMGVPLPLRTVVVGNDWAEGTGDSLTVQCPIDGSVLAKLKMAAPSQVTEVIASASAAFREWRTVPAPVRGELVRRIGNRLRDHKDDLATLVTLECGKIKQEALGEVQEMIDVCDFAVGLSRQLYGKTMASERPEHRLTEQWHPIGPIGVISAFNFPVAVWAWNAMIALVCGDPVVWKPSEKTPLTAMACHAIAMKTIDEMPDASPDLLQLVIGAADVGQAIAESPALPLISATGSTRMGRAVAQVVATRLGRSLLELGGNNGMIVAPSADMELAMRSIVFAAVGTCGQRCTSLRRLFAHESIADALRDRLIKVFADLPIGDPLADGTLIGPLIDSAAGEAMQAALKAAKEQGGTIHGGGMADGVGDGVYVHPALVEIAPTAEILQTETFAPILYFARYDDLDKAIELHNGVPQGLASAILTKDVQEAELFCSPAGSDCGIANVNIGTSGAEIGGAFGGEKDTGGGRESGSDSWKAYMRRATNTINYSDQLPLAQGIKFDF